MNIFVYLLFGHIVGDFFLQPKAMAVRKGTSNRIAFAHVFIYTTAVMLFTAYFLPGSHPLEYITWYLIVFIPHFLIDRCSLADAWLDFINGRSARGFLEKGHEDIPIKRDINWGDNEDKWHNYHILRGGFTAIVYVMVDNTSHLMCLWFGFKLLTQLFQ